MILILWSGCREISVTTVVNKNGSFTRTIRITGDSAEVYDPDLPYPVDSSWEQEFRKDTASDKKFILTYSRTFSTSEDLNSAIISNSGWGKHLKKTISVSSRFGFFYSYLNFKEIIPATNPFTFLDYRAYLTPQDLRYLAGDHSIGCEADSLVKEETKAKMERFLLESATGEIEQILKEGLTRLHDPSLNASDVMKFHDSIQKKVEEWNLTDANKRLLCSTLFSA